MNPQYKMGIILIPTEELKSELHLDTKREYVSF